MRRLAALLLLAGGCGGGAAAPAQSTGAVTVGFVAPSLPAPPLTIAAAALDLEDVALFGDVQTAPGFMLPDVAVNVLTPSTPLTMNGLPQGVYSRLRFSVQSLQASGQWRDRPLIVDLVDRDDDDDVVADLRAPAGAELTAGDTVGFAVTTDVAAWFAAVDLDTADVDADGSIRLGDGHNGALIHALLAAVPDSFQLAASTR